MSMANQRIKCYFVSYRIAGIVVIGCFSHNGPIKSKNSLTSLQICFGHDIVKAFFVLLGIRLLRKLLGKRTLKNFYSSPNAKSFKLKACLGISKRNPPR